MSFTEALELLNYAFVFFFGMFLSVDIAGSCEKGRKQRGLVIFGLALLALQGGCMLAFDAEAVRYSYPLITHLPLILVLVLYLKRPVGSSIVSVSVAYLCCQLPRWLRYAVGVASGLPIAGELSYALLIWPIYILLRRFFVRAVHETMSYSRQSLIIFGSLPVVYYFFDYATAVYSDLLYTNIRLLSEFLPTAFIIFYVVFVVSYHVQSRKNMEAELRGSMLRSELKQAGTEIEALRRAESRSALLQHDMRHHLNAIAAYLAADSPDRAEEYIHRVQEKMASATPGHWCENELINLLCASFSEKAERMGVRLRVEAKVPKRLSVGDTELCSLLSNGLENALNAVENLDESLRQVDLHCEKRHRKLLIEIKNPYSGEIVMKNGLPLSTREGHGYGCRSIKAICEGCRGICSFEAEGGVFTLRAAIPVAEENE